MPTRADNSRTSSLKISFVALCRRASLGAHAGKSAIASNPAEFSGRFPRVSSSSRGLASHLRPVTTVQTEVLRATSVGGKSHLYRDPRHASGVHLLPGDILEYFRARSAEGSSRNRLSEREAPFEFRRASPRSANKCQSLVATKCERPGRSPRRSADRKWFRRPSNHIGFRRMT